MRRTPKKTFRLQSSRKSASVDDLLQQVIFALAHILVPAGYGIGRVNQLTRAAFVDAAKHMHARTGRKLNIARIAVVTGLTRTEVSQLLREQKAGRHLQEPKNRALRVAKGWKADKNFASRSGNPAELEYLGDKRSFAALVKRYSGDIPPRAMLDEMKRLRLVQENSVGRIALVKSDIDEERKTLVALSAASNWVNALARSIEKDETNVLKYRANHFPLQFDSFPQAMAGMRELESRQAAFVHALQQIAPGNRRGAGLVVDVSVALAAARPRQVLRGARSDKK